MTQGRYARRSYPGTAVPFEQDVAVSSDSDAVFATIQAAINATSQGGRVAVGPGTYVEQVDVDVQDLALIGSGRGTVVDGTDGSALSVTETGVNVESIVVQTNSSNGGHGFSVQPFSPGNGQDETNIILRDILTLDTGTRGISMLDAFDSGVINAIVAGAPSDAAIRMDRCDRGYIHGLQNMTANSVQVFSSPNARIAHVTSLERVLRLATGSPGATVIGCEIVDSLIEGLRVESDKVNVVGGRATGSGNEDLFVTGNDVTIEGFGYTTHSITGARVTVDGKWHEDSIPTVDLGGTDEESTPTVNRAPDSMDFLVDAGGSATTIQGFDPQNDDGTSIAERGHVVWFFHAGGENVTFEDDNAGASNPFKNQTNGNVTLDANDEFIAYKFDGSAWRETTQNVQA